MPSSGDQQGKLYLQRKVLMSTIVWGGVPGFQPLFLELLSSIGCCLSLLSSSLSWALNLLENELLHTPRKATIWCSNRVSLCVLNRRISSETFAATRHKSESEDEEAPQ